MERRKGRPNIGGGGEEEEHSADCVARRLTLREREKQTMGLCFGVDLFQSYINNHTYIKSYIICYYHYYYYSSIP